jgi:hypothetical protein
VFYLTLIFMLVLPGIICRGTEFVKQDTKITIKNKNWYINNSILNPGSPAEGLLMNVRMVNSVFEDRGEGLSKRFAGFDPMANTDSFISKIPEYVASGVNAFTISLQGGSPGFEGAINTAFNADGSLRDDYLKRVEKVIRASDANNAAVILSCFYQRQHSHPSALTGKKSIMNALENTVNWITEKKFTNVLLEISNEYRHGGYRNWPDGEWLVSDAGQVELIRMAKRLNPALLVSTSAMGDGKYNELLAQEADFITIHFNNTSLEDYQSRIEALKKFGKPIICNEDDKLMQEAAIALSLSVLNGCGWGYMNIKRNQEAPFEYLGTKDDTTVYRMFRNVATPGYQINPESLKKTSITITYPNDGLIFRAGQNIDIKLSHLYPDNSIPYNVEIHINNKKIAVADEKLRVTRQINESGVFILEAVVKGADGKELYRSPKVDIIVQPEK